jgi:23S rRNA (cytosine1962-C5)-methyltransferase
MYSLLDCGNQKKLEKIGKFIIIRPAPQAIWQPFNPQLWQTADAEFNRNKGEQGEWTGKDLPETWQIEQNGTKWNINPNHFGNIGVFTEHWTYTEDLLSLFKPKDQILNLFCYSGSSVMEVLKKGYRATAVDASKNAITMYNENMSLNGVNKEGQRLILEDAIKFCEREIRRGNQYDSIICDMPSYGKGTKGEVFDIDEKLVETLKICETLLSGKGKMILTLHSPRYTPASLQILCQQIFDGKKVELKEILNPCESGVSLPSGFLVKIW